MDAEDLNKAYEYLSVDDFQKKQMEDNRAAFWRTAHDLNVRLPEGRYKALALTHLEEALMWANKSISHSKTVK